MHLNFNAQGADLSLGNNADSTALHTASQNGQQSAVEILLAAGADVSLKDSDGNTAYDVAVERGHAHIARLLAAGVGKAALASALLALGEDEKAWKVGAMKEALRRGGVSCEAVTEKGELLDNAHTRPHHRERVGVQDVRGAGTGDANEYKRRHAHSPALLMSLSIQALTAQTCVPTTESRYGYASAITSIANKVEHCKKSHVKKDSGLSLM